MSAHKHSCFFRQIVMVILSGVLLFQTACGSSAIDSRPPAESSSEATEGAAVSTTPVTSEEGSMTNDDSTSPSEKTSEPESTADTTKTTEAESTAAPSTTTEPETTAAPSTTTEPESTAAPSTTTEPESTAAPETQAPETTPEAATTAAPEPSTAAPVNGPHVEEGPIKDMLRQGLSWVSRSMGYSMEDRAGAGGHFDCSGLVAVLLRDGLGEATIGWFGNDPWDTAYWRYFASQYAEGNRLQIGNAVFEVHFRESYDFSHAWEVPGSIVVQYPPENDPSVKSGHISLALGTIPYETTDDVVRYLQEEYGIELTGITGNNGNIPMVYDPNGVGSGHVTWKINANGVALATCVDNNYCNDPSWIERISAVFVPVTE